MRSEREGTEDMAGRKPLGPQLVHHLEGSERAKERLEVILETVAGKLTIHEACDRLGIEEAMFFRLRMQALQAGLCRLEPRPAGRPPRSQSVEGERIAELEKKEKELEASLADPAIFSDKNKSLPLLNEYGDIRSKLEELMSTWEYHLNQLEIEKKTLGLQD